jgi:hypothetical protein
VNLPTQPPPSSPAESVLADYFRAKDTNRPHLLERVFASDARLEVRNASTAIAFPAVTIGREEIAQVLVRQFGRTYENVYSFYLARPEGVVGQFTCPWLVGMTDKASQSVRVGCGTYDWSLAYEPRPIATALVISIEVMQVLDPSTRSQVLAWLEALAYPWSTATAVVHAAPVLDDLKPVLDYLRGNVA